jgi:hypothetical protein
MSRMRQSLLDEKQLTGYFYVGEETEWKLCKQEQQRRARGNIDRRMKLGDRSRMFPLHHLTIESSSF